MTQEEELCQLREENAALRAENQKQRELIEDLLPLKEQVVSLSAHLSALQEQVAKDSHNSHLPPSSDRFRRGPRSLRKKSEKKRGGQAGHEGHHLQMSESPNQVVRHEVLWCSFCQRDLSQTQPRQVERRQVMDVLVPRVQVVEHQTEQKICPHCQQVSQAAFPQGVEASVQYGPAICALALYLNQYQLLPVERTCQSLKDVLAVPMSAATLAQIVRRAAKVLAPIEEEIKEHLRLSPVLQADESGLRVMGQRWWMQVACTAHLTHYGVHPKRGQEAMRAIDILPRHIGTLVHDGLHVYWVFKQKHALCNVHHLRELLFVVERHGQAWAQTMMDLLGQMHTAVKEAKAAGFSQLCPQSIRDFTDLYDLLLGLGYQANPPDPPNPDDPPNGRGRKAQSRTRNLLDRLDQHREAVLRFLSDFSVPFDNSQAERDIRMVKLQQKISGTFRGLEGATAFCRIRGYLSTMHKQGLPLLNVLESALAGHPISPAFSLS